MEATYMWPTEEEAVQAWEILYGKCKIPLKQRIKYRRETLPNGIKVITFGAWEGISSHPEVYDPMTGKEDMYILYLSDLSVSVGKVTSEGRYIRYPARKLASKERGWTPPI
jgi:hypothetical protein